MGEHTTVVIDWRGPYTLEEVKSNPDLRCGIYLASGKRKNKQIEEVQYCGITEGSFAGRLVPPHKIFEINRQRRLWLGTVSYPSEVTRCFLEIAESIIIYFWQPALNERKTVNPPKPVTLVSRWFKRDGTPRMRQHTLCKDIDDVLSWDGTHWRTGNLSVWED